MDFKELKEAYGLLSEAEKLDYLIEAARSGECSLVVARTSASEQSLRIPTREMIELLEERRDQKMARLAGLGVYPTALAIVRDMLSSCPEVSETK